MSTVTLITGGARSGKSTFAEKLAAERGRTVVYVATSVPFDGEMRDRIAKHVAHRPSDWITVEAPLDLSEGLVTGETILVDCLTLWISNRLMALGNDDADGWWDRVAELEDQLLEELLSLVEECRVRGQNLILVTNEVGMSLVPITPIGRAFRDIAGRLGQAVAQASDETFLVVLGMVLDLNQIRSR